jgi:stage III sporulation protein SpoIIIAA
MWRERLWRFSTGMAHLPSPEFSALFDAFILVRRRQQDPRPKQVSSLKAAYALFQSTTKNVVARDLDAFQVFYRMAGLRWIKQLRGHMSKVVWLKKAVARERQPEKDQQQPGWTIGLRYDAIKSVHELLNNRNGPVHVVTLSNDYFERVGRQLKADINWTILRQFFVSHPRFVVTMDESGPMDQFFLGLNERVEECEENAPVGPHRPLPDGALWSDSALGEKVATWTGVARSKDIVQLKIIDPLSREAPSCSAVSESLDDVADFVPVFSVLPPAMGNALLSALPAVLSTLHCIAIDLGQPVTLIRWSREPPVRLLSLDVVSEMDLKIICDNIGGPLQRRGSAAVGDSLHHCHAITDPASGMITGITICIGRNVTGVADGLNDIVLSGKNIAVLGFGKTTLLRDMVARLALQQQEVVMVIDTRGVLGCLQCATHPSLGHVRRIVPEKGGQASAIRAAIEKHAAKLLAIDDLWDPVDFDELNDCARVRGVQVIAGCPGGLEELQTLRPEANFEIVVQVLAPASYRVHNLVDGTIQLRMRAGQNFVIRDGNA